MKKIYLLLLAFVVLHGANAQRGYSFNMHPVPNFKKGTGIIRNGLAGGCDTLNTSLFNDSAVYYNMDPSVGTGFLTGTNSLLNLGNAQYFLDTLSTDNYITEAFVYFALASTTTPSKVVPIDVFDGTGGTVGALLGTTNLTMQTIMSDVNGNYLSHVVFNPAIPLPASKEFFLAVDYSNLSYTKPVYDTLVVVSTDINVATGTWQNDNTKYWHYSGWNSFPYDWSIDVGLFMFPLASANQTCTAMPVHLTSFTAQAKETSVLLNWQVTQEVNMKQYDVERAGSNLQFVYAGTVPATNSTINHAYSYTDANAVSAASGDLFYRLKQVNADGNITYSNVIRVPITGATLTAKVVNPFHNVVQVNVTSPIAQTMQATVYDVQGRKVATLGSKLLAVGDNAITLPTGPLAKGIYILNLSTGTTVYTYKIINQ